jgi:hypothetical protein
MAVIVSVTIHGETYRYPVDIERTAIDDMRANAAIATSVARMIGAKALELGLMTTDDRVALYSDKPTIAFGTITRGHI